MKEHERLKNVVMDSEPCLFRDSSFDNFATDVPKRVFLLLNI